MICADLEEAMLSPFGAPGVPDDPVPRAAAADPIMASHLSVAYEYHAVIDLSVTIAAVKELISKHSALVRSEHASGVNSNRYWLCLEEHAQLLIASPVVLDVADVLHVHRVVCSVLASVASLFLLAIWVVIASAKDAVL